MESENSRHIPVLASETLASLCTSWETRESIRLIDCTVGYGGHSSLILRTFEKAELLGIDRDGDALSCAQKALSFAGARVHLERGDFSRLADFADRIGWNAVDGILLDAGISSGQIDRAERGFAHRLDGPLDMRMDTRSPLTACRVLNQYTEAELERIFREYGEIRYSRKLAAAIVERRSRQPWCKTRELAELCERVLPNPRRGPPPPTLCFQAIRIAVNNELAELESAVQSGIRLLKTGGRFAVISFHSLEDRIVKHAFRKAATKCICPPGLPVCCCGHRPSVQLVTRSPIRPGAEEIARNSRAASAKLRVIEKIEPAREP